MLWRNGSGSISVRRRWNWSPTKQFAARQLLPSRQLAQIRPYHHSIASRPCLVPCIVSASAIIRRAERWHLLPPVHSASLSHVSHLAVDLPILCGLLVAHKPLIGSCDNIEIPFPVTCSIPQVRASPSKVPRPSQQGTCPGLSTCKAHREQLRQDPICRAHGLLKISFLFHCPVGYTWPPMPHPVIHLRSTNKCASLFGASKPKSRGHNTQKKKKYPPREMRVPLLVDRLSLLAQEQVAPVN